MFQFEKRHMDKQGSSLMISHPTKWINGFRQELTAVKVEMDDENNVKISPVLAPTVADDILHPVEEVQNDKWSANN